MGQQPSSVEDSRSHSDTRQSVGLLWMSDQPVAKTPTWQYATLTTDRQTDIHAPGGIRNPHLSRRAAADLRHWDRRIPLFTCIIYPKLPVPVAGRSKAWVCGLSPAEIVGSNPTGGMDVCLLWVLFIVRYSSLRRADHSSRRVLPTVLRRCVWSRNLVNEETLAHLGAVAPKTNGYPILISCKQNR